MKYLTSSLVILLVLSVGGCIGSSDDSNPSDETGTGAGLSLIESDFSSGVMEDVSLPGPGSR